MKIRAYFSSTNFIEGETYTEILEQMMLEDWTDYLSITEFTHNLQRRVAYAMETIIPVDTPEKTVKALHQIGIINQLFLGNTQIQREDEI